jgi:predicted Zn finger-like uncharacterized protein
MKITCDNCGAKYSIADEKVKGKVFKIRCKKCSQIIVVRGTSEDDASPGAEAATPASSTDDAVWHVVIGRDQVGPMTGRDVRDRFAAGEITLESYIWREGFGDWQRLSDVSDFADVASAPGVGAGAPVAAAPAGAEEPAAGSTDWQAAADRDNAGWSGGLAAGAGAAAGGEETQRADSASLFGGLDSPDAAAAPAGGDDLFGGAPAAEQPASDGMFASSARPGGAGLFGDDGYSGESHDAVPKDPAVPVDTSQMTGQRGENSVLFSLANLQQLAMGGKDSAPSPAAPSPSSRTSPSSSASPSAPATTGGGGSGLIDIRAMAASTAASDARADDDLPPAIGGFGGAIAAAPVLMPTDSDEKPKWVLPALIGAGVAVIAAVAVVIVVVSGDKKPATTVAANTPAAENKTAGGVTEKTGTTPTDDKTPKKPAAATDDKTADTAADDKTGDTKTASADTKSDKTSTDTSKGGRKVARASGRRTRRGRKGRRGRRSTSSGTKVAMASPRKTSSPTRTRSKPQKGRRDELDDLLDGAMGKKKKRRAARAPTRTASSNSNLQERLTRSQIQSGMRRIKPRIKKCYDRFKVPGMAMVKVTIGGSGRVSSVRVSGVFGGTPTGGCVTKAVRSARFPKSKNSTTITYPFQLR